MRGPLLFLVTSFAASVVAAPVPVSAGSPVEVAGSLMAREASESVTSPVLDTIKRNLLERLDAIIAAKRTVTVRDPADTNDKREPVSLPTVPSNANNKRQDSKSSSANNGVIDRRESVSHPTVPLNANDKREPGSPPTVLSNANNKRQDSKSSSANNGVVDRRESVSHPTVPSNANNKRQDSKSSSANNGVIDRRESVSHPTVPSNANDKRQDSKSSSANNGVVDKRDAPKGAAVL